MSGEGMSEPAGKSGWRVAVLGGGRVILEGTIKDMLRSEEPWIKAYFRGKRARQPDLAARRR